MRSRGLAEAEWLEVTAVIADRTGLYFPPERREDLYRGLRSAAEELALGDATHCAEWLLSHTPTREQIAVLSSHLTVGETYFFRDEASLSALRDRILPPLIHARRGGAQRLRLWSAACSSGEEPYSLAILLFELLPDLRNWQVTITATDINPRSLRKAVAGIYSDWSFRGAPSRLRQRYFTNAGPGRYAIVPEIRQMVSFAHLNLVEDTYPSVATDTNAMDLIFCRNVLMYFAPEQTRKVVTGLRRALIDGGWLAVSPSEASASLFPGFSVENFPAAIFFRKLAEHHAAAVEPTPAWFAAEPETEISPAPPPHSSGFNAGPESPSPEPDQHSVLEAARMLHARGDYEDCAALLLRALGQRAIWTEAFALLARTRANQGRLAEALTWCDRWAGADKTDPAAHYLRAVVLGEQGEIEESVRSLQRALYLAPDFVMAHFALGNAATHRGRIAEAAKHFRNARRLLSEYGPDDVLPESEGLTAGRLAETVAAIADPEVA